MTESKVSARRIGDDLVALMAIPGLCGYEGRVRAWLQHRLDRWRIPHLTDPLGNLICTLEGNRDAPALMLFAHMDQLGFVVRKIEPDGFVRIERVGGVPERALASQRVLFQIGEDRDVPGIIANKSHHATAPEEKYETLPYRDLYIDVGLDSAEAAHKVGIKIGTPVVYHPQVVTFGDNRVAGTSVDDRAGCAVLLEVLRHLITITSRPPVHIVFSVQEEFNLRGVITAARTLKPDIAIQLDLVIASDTPDMANFGAVRLGGGPAMSLYSFHGRGTLNGAIAHPALVQLFERAGIQARLGVQRSAHIGALTETSYVQLVGQGVAVIDVGFPCRYTHSSLEMCDIEDLKGLSTLLLEAIPMIDSTFSLDRNDFEQ